jgi:hypothetical protein
MREGKEEEEVGGGGGGERMRKIQKEDGSRKQPHASRANRRTEIRMQQYPAEFKARNYSGIKDITILS